MSWHRISKLVLLVGLLNIAEPAATQSALLLLGAGGGAPGGGGSGQSFTDNFDTDPFASRWALLRNCTSWNSTDLDIDCTPDNGSINLIYNTTLDSIDHEAQVTLRGPGSGSSLGPGPFVRSDDSLLQGYTAEYVNYGGSGTSAIRIRRVSDDGPNDFLDEVSVSGTFVNDQWVTIRMAAEGAVGGDVVLSFWVQLHGSGTKPSDPGWIGSNGSPDATYTDTGGAGRRNAATFTFAGIGGGGTHPDSSNDYWKARDISAR